MPLAALPIARPDFNRIFLLPPFKINTAGTPHRRITEETFLNAPRHSPTQDGSCQRDTTSRIRFPTVFSLLRCVN